MRNIQFYIGWLGTLILGSLIYVFFRTTTLRMFCWFGQLNILSFIDRFRVSTLFLKNYLPNWFLYSLPDGLWIFSYLSLALYIWKNELKSENLFWIFSIPIIAIGSEIGQLIKIIPGTFDIIDLIIYVLGTILPFIIFKKLVTHKY